MQYLLLIYNDSEKMKGSTPAEQAAFAEDYRSFNEWLKSTGSVRGTATWPAGISTVRVAEGKTLTTDGPFAETREGVGGFVVIDVPDLDAAIKVAARIPSARAGAIEVRPVTSYPAA
jgi:hypothetical protein